MGQKMHTLTRKLAASRNGATVIGYGLIAGLIAIAVMTIVTSVGAGLTYAESDTHVAIIVPHVV